MKARLGESDVAGAQKAAALLTAVYKAGWTEETITAAIEVIEGLKDAKITVETWVHDQFETHIYNNLSMRWRHIPVNILQKICFDPEHENEAEDKVDREKFALWLERIGGEGEKTTGTHIRTCPIQTVVATVYVNQEASFELVIRYKRLPNQTKGIWLWDLWDVQDCTLISNGSCHDLCAVYRSVESYLALTDGFPKTK